MTPHGSHLVVRTARTARAIEAIRTAAARIGRPATLRELGDAAGYTERRVRQLVALRPGRCPWAVRVGAVDGRPLWVVR